MFIIIIIIISFDHGAEEGNTTPLKRGRPRVWCREDVCNRGVMYGRLTKIELQLSLKRGAKILTIL